MKSILVSLSSIVVFYTLSTSALAASPALGLQQRTDFLRVGMFTTIRVRQMVPVNQPVRADVLYLHGFSDRSDNHGPLFRQLAAAGIRVVAFDYPSHGETRSASLGWYSFRKLMAMIVAVEHATVEDPNRPLFLAGWSTGGLLAVRLVQTKYALNALSRPLAGIVLYAPGVAVRMIPGEGGKVTERSLTHDLNPPHHGKPRPSSPFKKPVFSARLMFNSILSRMHTMPADVPVLTFVGGDKEDTYADSKKVRAWVLAQRKSSDLRPGVQCTWARHELDNEAAPVGQYVRDATLDFVVQVLDGSAGLTQTPLRALPPPADCVEF